VTSVTAAGGDKVARTAAPFLLALPFVITFLDSAFAYFGHPRGFTITPNALVPFILVYFAIFDPSVLRLPLRTLVWLGLLSASFCLAVLTAVDISVHRVLETGSCVASFYAGFLLWRRSNDENQLARWMIVMSLIYVTICLIALQGIAPAYFPVNNHYWSQEGLAQARPAVTADSNMQIYYVFPAALALALPFRLFRTSIAVVVSLGALFVLTQLQTRSGTLVFAGILLLALAAPLWNPSLGRKKMLIYPVIAVVAVTAFWPTIHGAVELLLYRFNDSDVASGNGRVQSTVYAFKHLLDPYWWIPRGANEFLTRYGGLPHSNITAIYLDGGLLGLIAWAALVIAPIWQMTAMMFRRQTDAAATMVLIAAIAVLLVQLSLHNPFRDQVWLWAGALTGALVRLRSDQPATAEVTQPLAVTPAAALRVDATGIINAPVHR
jgi:O-antigen ligase